MRGREVSTCRMHAPDGPVSAGWVQSSRFLDQLVFEGASRVGTVFEGRASNSTVTVRASLMAEEDSTREAPRGEP